MNRFSKLTRAAWIVIAAVWIAAAGLLQGADSELHFLNPGVPQPELLAPPPLPGSPDQASDMAAVVAAFNAASSNETALAFSEKKFGVFNFAPAVGSGFQSNTLPKTAAFFARVKSDAALATDAAKERWKRPRPFTVNTNLATGSLEKSYSYPSGHSTEATVLALVLADVFPEKRTAIEAVSRDIGWRRVLIARHYPTDIHAGRTFAIAIYTELKKSPQYQRELEEVKAETTSVSGTP